jgi:hypothetical protein
MAGVQVTVNPVVFTDPAMTSGVTTLTSNALGIFQAYAPAGTYTFVAGSPLAAPLPDIVVLSANTPSDAVTLLTAAFARIDEETIRAEAAEAALLQLLAGGGGTPIPTPPGGNGPPVVSGLTIINRGDHSYAALPFGNVTITPNLDDRGNFLNTYTLTAADPVSIVPQADHSYEVFT